MKRDPFLPPLREASLSELHELYAKLAADREPVKHLPGSMPEWMRAEGGCEIGLEDEHWSKAGHEIH